MSEQTKTICLILSLLVIGWWSAFGAFKQEVAHSPIMPLWELPQSDAAHQIPVAHVSPYAVKTLDAMGASANESFQVSPGHDVFTARDVTARDVTARDVKTVSYYENRSSDTDVLPRFQDQIARPAERLTIMTSSATVDAIAKERIQYGKSLARRGAFFAAQEEFLNVLYHVAESHDRKSGGSKYSETLKAGLRALEEARDFGKLGRDNDSPQSRQFVLASHHTRIFEPTMDAGRYSCSQFVDSYCRYAKSKIEQAVGKSPSASEALFAYGKILAAESEGYSQHADIRKIGLSIFLASANADSRNHKSVNELGVRYLKLGYPSKAAEMLLRAIKERRLPAYWINLAEAHRQMANQAKRQQERNHQMTLANRALQEAKVESAKPQQMSSEKWVSSEQFQKYAAMPDSRLGTPRTSSLPSASTPRNESDRSLFKNIKKWF